MAKNNTVGVELRVGDGASTESFTAIGQVTDLAFDPGSKTELDSTDLASVAEEIKMGLQRGGSTTFTLHLDPKLAAHKDLFDEFNASDPNTKNYQIGLNNGSPESTITGAFYVQGFSIDLQTDALQTASLTLRRSGAITIANWAT